MCQFVKGNIRCIVKLFMVTRAHYKSLALQQSCFFHKLTVSHFLCDVQPCFRCYNTSLFELWELKFTTIFWYLRVFTTRWNQWKNPWTTQYCWRNITYKTTWNQLSNNYYAETCMFYWNYTTGNESVAVR